MQIASTQSNSIIFDDGEHFYRKLISLSHLLALLSHVVQRIELLDIICSLGERGLLPSGADGEDSRAKRRLFRNFDLLLA